MTEDEYFELSDIAIRLETHLEVFGKDYDRNGDESRECMLARAVALLARAIEAQRAETAETGSVHESAAPKGLAREDTL